MPGLHIEDGPGVIQEETVARAPRHKFHAGVGLAVVRFENQGKLPENGARVRLCMRRRSQGGWNRRGCGLSHGHLGVAAGTESKTHRSFGESRNDARASTPAPAKPPAADVSLGTGGKQTTT